MKTSPSQMQLHAKINRVQIDNQMYDCIFPVVLAPVPPPKSVAADSGTSYPCVSTKPFLTIVIFLKALNLLWKSVLSNY